MAINPASSTDGDDYWTLFHSLRARLNDLHKFRSATDDTWDKLQFETFAFKFRMIIEEISLFLRSALVARGDLSRAQTTAYGPKSILAQFEQQVSSMRFISSKSFKEHKLPDGDLELQFEYEDFHSFSVTELDELYGRLGNFVHPSLKSDREALARAVLEDCFAFFAKHQAIFHRHALEGREHGNSTPPQNLDGLLFIVGTTDDGRDVFWKCVRAEWTQRVTANRGAAT